MLLGKAAKHADTLVGVRPNALEDAPQLQMTVDRVQAQSMGLSLSDVYTAIQLMLAPVYVDDFDLRRPRAAREHAGRRAVPRRRRRAAAFLCRRQGCRANGGPAPMIPLSNVVQTQWTWLRRA